MKHIRTKDTLEPHIGDSQFMEKALSVARVALGMGDFPVGCVIEYDGRIIVTGGRTGTTGKNKNEVEHAEMNALRKLSSIDGSYDRSLMTLYSTLEPCLMCFGAILLGGITRIVFAYEDVMGGGTSCDLSKLPCLYSDSGIKIVSGVLREESLILFKLFFSDPDKTYWTNSKLSCYTMEKANY